MFSRRELNGRLERLRDGRAYRTYEFVREIVLAMMEEWAASTTNGPSAYWKEEVEGFAYLFDASPLIVERLREHCYHITGVKSYEYRGHHSHKSPQFENKFKMLAAMDRSDLFVPEAEELGGFGFDLEVGKANIDTLKFYEVLIGMDLAGILPPLRAASTRARRNTVMEIGSGWGGFARAFKTVCPHTTYICVDLPPTVLFSGVYLKTVYPDARCLFYGERDFAEEIGNYAEYDFVFLPHYFFEEFSPTELDLAINMVSFQEMTTEQVASYARGLLAKNTKALYSLNRDRSKHNPDLTSVSDILGRHLRMERVNVIDIPYTDLKLRKGDAAAFDVHAYKHYAGFRQDH